MYKMHKLDICMSWIKLWFRYKIDWHIWASQKHNAQKICYNPQFPKYRVTAEKGPVRKKRIAVVWNNTDEFQGNRLLHRIYVHEVTNESIFCYISIRIYCKYFYWAWATTFYQCAPTLGTRLYNTVSFILFERVAVYIDPDWEFWNFRRWWWLGTSITCYNKMFRKYNQSHRDER